MSQAAPQRAPTPGDPLGHLDTRALGRLLAANQAHVQQQARAPLAWSLPSPDACSIYMYPADSTYRLSVHGACAQAEQDILHRNSLDAARRNSFSADVDAQRQDVQYSFAGLLSSLCVTGQTSLGATSAARDNLATTDPWFRVSWRLQGASRVARIT